MTIFHVLDMKFTYERSNGGAGPEHCLHHGQRCGGTRLVAPHGQRVDRSAHGGLCLLTISVTSHVTRRPTSHGREGSDEKRQPQEHRAGLDVGQEPEHDVGQAGADAAEHEQSGR